MSIQEEEGVLRHGSSGDSEMEIICVEGSRRNSGRKEVTKPAPLTWWAERLTQEHKLCWVGWCNTVEKDQESGFDVGNKELQFIEEW